ncbi:MAG: mandelate racemase [Alphaproteobacteria bacterium]|nr:mandelate racemase [Alphaproteobacteria bacterium]
MRIVAVTERTIDIATMVRSASMSLGAMTASALALHTDTTKGGKPVVGLAFDSIGRYGHGGLLRERFIPRLTAADPDRYSDGNGGIDPHRAWDVMMADEKPAGHGERCGAVGLIDAALWDLAAKQRDEPLWRTLSDGTGARGTIALYASGGHYRAHNDIARLCDDVRRAIGRGHRRFKIKIGGATIAEDLRRIEALLALLEAGMTLAVDGNGTFSRDVAFAYLEALAPYPLAWVEEPVSPLDFELHGAIAERSPLPLATGENIFSHDDARNLLRYGGLRRDRDVLQFDISLSYGIVEYRRILALLDQHQWKRERCAPHAGHLLAAHCVAGLGLGLAEVAMDETTLFGRLTAELAIDDGGATLADTPGVGFEALAVFPELFGGVLH